MKDELTIDPANVDVPIIGEGHQHRHNHAPKTARYEGLVAIRDPEKRGRVVGYVHPPTRTLFDEKSQFSQPTVFRNSGPAVNQKHLRRVELAGDIINKLANGQELD